MTHAAFVHCQHMDGCTEVKVNPSASISLHDLAGHAGPRHVTAAHGLRGRDLDHRIGRVSRGATMQDAVMCIAAMRGNYVRTDTRLTLRVEGLIAGCGVLEEVHVCPSGRCCRSASSPHANPKTRH